jgi:hypothetical protein
LDHTGDEEEVLPRDEDDGEEDGVTIRLTGATKIALDSE